MKKIILILTALFAFVQGSIADNVYSIYLESPELVAGDTIAVEHLDMILYRAISVSSSVAVEDGHILIEDTVPEFSRLRLKCLGKTSDGLVLYVEPGQHLTLNVPSLKYMDESVPEGGFYADKIVHDYFLFKADKAKILNQAMAKLDSCLVTGDSDSIEMATKRVVEIQNGTRDERKYELSFLFRRDCPVAAYLFAQKFADFRGRLLERHWRRLRPEVKQSDPGKWYGRIVEIRKSLRKRSVAPAFNLTCTDGSTVGLENLRGKYVLLYYWERGCGYVMMSSPNLIALHNKYKEKLEVIALTDSGTYSELTSQKNEDPSMKPYHNLLEQDWKTVLFDKAGNEQTARDYLATFLIPRVVLISPEGRIIKWGGSNVLKTADRRLRRN